MSRIIALVDMDCFYVQVEERDNPHIKGVPAAVVQYNAWKGGGIIAVNYEARAEGVSRQMRGDDAKKHCPNIQLVQVPVLRGKANLTKYRDAGKEVINVLTQFSDIVERASIDEAYIDLSESVADRLKKFNIDSDSFGLKSTWVVGFDHVEEGQDKEEARVDGVKQWEQQTKNYEDDLSPSDDLRLAMAAIICEEMRAEVLKQTGFKCSAGISHSKMLSKLACGLHKPNQQTILPQSQVMDLWTKFPVHKVRNLGGKLGASLKEDFGCETMGDVAKLSLSTLRSRYDDKTAQWLIDLGRGIDREKVTARQLPKSIGCGKNFQGPDVLNTKEKVNHWLSQLTEELSERLEKDLEDNKRRAKSLTVGIRMADDRFTTVSRACPIPSYHANEIHKIALATIQHLNKSSSKDSIWHPPILNISLSGGKFEDVTSGSTASIQDMFKKVAQNNSNGNRNHTKVQENTHKVVNKKKLTGFESYFKNSEKNESDLNGKCPGKVENSMVLGKSSIDVVSQKSHFSEEQFYNSPQRKLTEIIENAETDGSNSTSNNIHLSNSCDKSNYLNFNCTDKGESSGTSFFRSIMLKKKLEQEIAGPEEIPKNLQENKQFEELSENESDNEDLSLLVDELDNKEENLAESTNDNLPADDERTSFMPNQSGEESKITPNSSLENRKLLNEIFPNINDIDESTLECLPNHLKIELQKMIRENSKSKNKLNASISNKYENSKSNTNQTSNNNLISNYMIQSNELTNSIIENNNVVKTEEQLLSSEVNVIKQDEDMIDCPECGKKIWVFDSVEHNDYHMAVKLRNCQQNEKPVLNRSLKENEIYNKGKKRIKNSSNSPNKFRKLDSYFKCK